MPVGVASPVRPDKPVTSWLWDPPKAVDPEICPDPFCDAPDPAKNGIPPNA